MPGTFFDHPIIAQTKNFLITADENSDATERALAIAGICESDLSKLEKLFKTNFQTGETHKYSTWVHVVAPGAGNGASNYGFERSQSNRIFIFGTFNPPPPPPPPIIPPDPLPPVPPNPSYIKREYACFLFVAELAEVLMDFTGGAWGRGDSSGEGLSIYLGTLLHPDGYYGAISSPRINAWLNADRRNQNWVSATELSDSNLVSHACALLFIYYLVNQLGFPIEKVIAAYRYKIKSTFDFHNGWTLSDTFAELSGQPASSAFTQFSNLVEIHLPFGMKVFVGHDNIFPLRDPSGRSVSINQSMRMMTIFKNPVPEKFKVQPGLFCEKKSYDFYPVTETEEYSLYANCRGILNAAYTWKINGTDLPVRGKQGSVIIAIERTVRTPDDKKKVTGNSITLNYVVQDSWNKSVLILRDTDSSLGNCVLNVTALATEGAINDAKVSADSQLSVDPLSYEAGEEYKKDRRRCNKFYANLDDSLYSLSATLANLKNRPDPPSEHVIFEVLEIVAKVEHDAQHAAHSSGITRKQLFKQLTSPGALISNEIRATPEILNLVQPNLQHTMQHTNADNNNLEENKEVD